MVIRSLKERFNAPMLAAAILLLLVDILFLWSALVPWMTQPVLGWSLPQRMRSSILIFLILSTVLLTALVLRRPNGKKKKAVFLALLSVVTLLLGAFVAAYEPPRPWLTPEQLADLGLTDDYFLSLPPCEQVKVFAEVGYDRIDWEHSAVLVPDWMGQYLQNNPKPVLADCFEREIRSQIVWLQGDNQRREVATKKIYALYLEADFLDVLGDSPSLLELEKFLICEKQFDTMGRLSHQYYIAEYRAVPQYDYFGDAGLRRLKSEICQP